MNLTINVREAEALLNAVEGYLPQLEFAIARMEHHPSARHELVVQDELLIGLRARLREALAEEGVRA